MYNNLEIIKPLKNGGQKEVYLAHHPVFGKVVLKIIISKDDSLYRTIREVRAVKLSKKSSHIPQIFDHNCNDNNADQIWLIEQYISGKNLRELFQEKKIFNLNEIVLFLETILDLCILSENNNLVHRDIKPENLMLDEDGKFWLLDYGIARHLDLKSLTESNDFFGPHTIGYASSEQFKNLKKDIDIRADLFSLGVVCYEMLNGENFYTTAREDDIFKVLKKIETNSLPPLRIKGDKEYKLSTFISLLGDHRRNRRPKTAKEAKEIFNSFKNTLKLK